MAFYFTCLKYPVSEAVKKVKVWLIAGSDIKAMKTDVVVAVCQKHEDIDIFDRSPCK